MARENKSAVEENNAAEAAIKRRKINAKNLAGLDSDDIRAKMVLAFRSIEHFKQLGMGVYGYFFVLKYVTIFLSLYFVALLPILYWNFTAEYSENSVEQDIKGNILKRFSIDYKKNLNVAP